MRLKKISVLLIVFCSLFLISCNDDPSAIGAHLLTPDLIDIEQINSLNDSIPQSSLSRTIQISLGSSARLLAGRYENAEASFLLRFSIIFPDSLKADLLANNINVNSAWVELTRTYTYGDTNGVLGLNVYKINSSWSSAGFIADSLAALSTTELVVEPVVTDSITTINLTTDLGLEWLKYSADPSLGTNWGVLISPDESSSKIFGYQSLISNAAGVPVLHVVIEKAGVFTDTLQYFTLADISAVKEIIPLPGGELLSVQSGLKTISHISYDLSSIPQSAVINKADLVLSSNEGMNITGTDEDVTVIGYLPADSTNIDSIASGTFEFTKSSNLFTATITPLVQEWLSSRNFRGIVLTTSNELHGLERFVFWGSSASNPELRPRLIITYTIKL